MWRVRLSRTWDWLKSRRIVGEDEHHLFYEEFIAKGKRERRYVEYKDNNITSSSDRMSVEWWSWLHNRRDDAPTIEEVENCELARRQLKERVALLEAEDERQRLRGVVSGSGNASSNTNENPLVELVMKSSMGKEEVEAKRRRKAMERLNNAAAGREASSVHPKGAIKIGSDGDDVDRNVYEEPTVCFFYIYIFADSVVVLTVFFMFIFHRELGMTFNQGLGILHPPRLHRLQVKTANVDESVNCII